MNNSNVALVTNASHLKVSWNCIDICTAEPDITAVHLPIVSTVLDNPGDLAAHARLHGKPFNCAHCSYSNTDIRNLPSHMRVHSRDAPFTCKMCGQKFVHSNQLIRHKPKCAKSLLKQDDWHYQKKHLIQWDSNIDHNPYVAPEWTITRCNTELSDETKMELF